MKNVFKKNSWLQIIAVVFIVLFCIFAFSEFTRKSTEYTLEVSRSRLSEITKKNADTIRIEVYNSLSSVRIASEAMGVFDDLHTDEAILRLKQISQYSNFDYMRVTTMDGVSWASPDDVINIKGRDYFLKALRGASGITNLLDSLSNGESIFVGYAPVVHNGNIVGTIHGTYKVARFLDILGMDTFEGTSHIHIIRKNGSQLLCSLNESSFEDNTQNLLEFLKGVSYIGKGSYNELYDDIQNGKSNFVSYTNRGEGFTAYYTPVGINDWYVVQAVPNTSIDKQVDKINGIALILVIEIMLLFAFIAVLTIVYSHKLNKATVEMNRRLQLSNERFEVAIFHSSNIIFDYNIFTGTIEFVTDVSDIFDFPDDIPLSPEYLYQLGVIEKDFVGEFKNAFREIKNGKAESTCEVKFQLKDGKTSWRKLTIVNLLDNDEPVYAVGVMEDITEIKENELRYEKEKQYRDAILLDAIDIYEIDLTLDLFQKGTTSGEEPLWLPYTKSNLEFAKNNIYIDDREKFLNASNIKRMIAAFNNNVTQELCEYRRTDLNGGVYWVASTTNLLRDPSTGNIKGFTYVRDIDEKKNKDLALSYRAEHDVLTGIYNRTASAKLISDFLETSALSNTTHGFFMMDLDRFKRINDTYGHMAGDEILKLVAQKMNVLFRASDIVARLGGDEFIIFLKNTHSEDHVRYKAKELGDCLRGLKPSCAEEDEGISTSIGVAIAPQHGTSFEELYKKADSALYAAKRSGRDRFVVYQDTIDVDEQPK